MYMKNNGFTLTELMIVIAIIGILAAIALPAYQDYVTQARRADAKSGLLNIQLALEKWRANNSSYTDDMTDLGYAGANDQSSPDGYYTLDIVSASSASYTITATPTSKSNQNTDDCGTFAIDQNGENYTGAYADADCWNR